MSHEQYQATIEKLHECMTACNHCYDACLQEDDVNKMVDCIRLDRECADICAYLEQALGRGTPFASQLAKVCAEICQACGDECNKHDHQHCQECAQACYACAEACNHLAS